MAPKLKKPTHTAWTFRRMGKLPHQGYWLEIGVARDDGDGKFHSFLDRLPIGGFSGRVIHTPINGPPPPLPEAAPQRPGETGEGDSGDEAGDAEE